MLVTLQQRDEEVVTTAQMEKADVNTPNPNSIIYMYQNDDLDLDQIVTILSEYLLN